MGNNQPRQDAFAFSERLNETLNALPGAPALKEGRAVWLARLMKVSKPTAQAWVNGDYMPVADRVKRLAELGGVSFEWLYFGRGTSSQDVNAPEGTGGGAAQAVRRDQLRLAFKLAAEAIGDDLELSPAQFAELGTLIYELLVEDGLPQAQVLQFARRSASMASGDDITHDPAGKDHAD